MIQDTLAPGAYLMIQDTQKRSLEERARHAMSVFEDRYGHAPTEIRLNAQQYAELAPLWTGSAALVASSQVQPNNFWLGMQPQ